MKSAFEQSHVNMCLSTTYHPGKHYSLYSDSGLLAGSVSSHIVLFGSYVKQVQSFFTLWSEYFSVLSFMNKKKFIHFQSWSVLFFSVKRWSQFFVWIFRLRKQNLQKETVCPTKAVKWNDDPPMRRLCEKITPREHFYLMGRQLVLQKHSSETTILSVVDSLSEKTRSLLTREQ